MEVCQRYAIFFESWKEVEEQCQVSSIVVCNYRHLSSCTAGNENPPFAPIKRWASIFVLLILCLSRKENGTWIYTYTYTWWSKVIDPARSYLSHAAQVRHYLNHCWCLSLKHWYCCNGCYWFVVVEPGCGKIRRVIMVDLSSLTILKQHRQECNLGNRYTM